MRCNQDAGVLIIYLSNESIIFCDRSSYLETGKMVNTDYMNEDVNTKMGGNSIYKL